MNRPLHYSLTVVVTCSVLACSGNKIRTSTSNGADSAGDAAASAADAATSGRAESSASVGLASAGFPDASLDASVSPNTAVSAPASMSSTAPSAYTDADTDADSSVPAVSSDAGSTPASAPDAQGVELVDTSVEAVDLSAEIYDPERLPRFDIKLPQASLEALNLVGHPGDPRQDTYVSAELLYENQRVSNIGLRLKGETSFQQLDRKPAFKLKFDEFVPDQTFHGLKRMSLNNLFEDASFIAERLAYDVYRAANLPAPRCNSALVYVNGEFYGVYANIEAEDKTFLRRWFQNVSGNLYEEGGKDFVPGAETAFILETNETKNDRSDLVGLITAIEEAGQDTFLDDIAAHLDINNYLKFTAVEAAVNQWDMYSYTAFWVNNLRVYNDPSTRLFHFIPWGHDLSMKPYRDSGKPYIRLFELARRYDAPTGIVTSGQIFQRCLNSPQCVAAYRAAAAEVATTYDGMDLEARAVRYYEQIKSAVYEDARKNVCCSSEPLSNQDFEMAYQAVLTTIRGRTAALRADLDAPVESY